MRYEYMIVYRGKKGVGRCFMCLDKVISSGHDVIATDEVIQKEMCDDTMHVVDFKLLREIKEN